MMRRLIHWIGGRTLLNLFLLLGAFASLGWGLSTVIRGFERDLATAIILLGLLGALQLSRSHVSTVWAALSISLVGIVGAIYHYAGLSNPLLSILRGLGSIPETLLGLHRWPDLTPLALSWQQLTGQLSVLLIRIIVWVTALLQGSFGVDPLVTGFLWSLVMWFITFWAAWGVFRLRRPLPAIAPAGILLAGALNYTHGDAIWLVPLLASTLLLMALGRYDAEEHYWRQQRIDYADDIRLDMLTVIPLLVIGLTVLSAFTPSISIRQIVQLVRNISDPYQSQAESLAESLGLVEPAAEPAALKSLIDPGLPQQHLLGAGPELSQQIVMVIQTGDLPPLSSIEVLPHPPAQYYWRSLTYDVYSGRGWSTSPTETIHYTAGQPAVVELPIDSPSVRVVNQTIQFSQASPGVLFATGLLITADLDFEVSWRLPLGENADAFGVTAETQRYTASSLLTTPSIEQLRASSSIYPEWVTSRYLKLPNNLPQRVRDLALDLTRGQPTPFDRASAIEEYVRSFPYSLEVPAPPPAQDVADYFLFDLQQGYCDYYATAMVVLTRAAGLPSRLVSGYASGSYDPPNARYVVTAANAHSWVEVYFPEVGWVEFEPTGGLPAIERNPSLAGIPQTIPEPKPVQPFNLWHWIKSTSWLGWLFGLIFTLFIIAVLWYWIDIFRLTHLKPGHALAVIYRRLTRHGELLVVGSSPGDTPSEYAARLCAILDKLAHNKYGRSLYKPAAREIDQLVELYNLAVFSPHPTTTAQHMQTIRIWLRLRWRLLAARFKT